MAVDTKGRILDVSERLFADRGFAKTSLRDITSEAGVNLAAVNYHFGSKEALLSAILERRFRPINDKRIALLDELEASAGKHGPELEDILRAFLGPPFQAWAEMGECVRKFLKLVGQIHAEINEEVRAVFIDQFDVVLQRYTAALQRALPDLEPDEVVRRSAFVVGAMAHTMIWGEQLDSRTPGEFNDPSQLLDSLVSFSAAGISAPVPLQVGVRATAQGRGT